MPPYMRYGFYFKPVALFNLPPFACRLWPWGMDRLKLFLCRNDLLRPCPLRPVGGPKLLN